MSPAMMPDAPKTFYSKKTHPSSSELMHKDSAPESTRPKPSPRQMLTSTDLQNVDPHTLIMALKSGLLAESAWALDTLNILLKDDRTMTFCQLASLPSLLGILVEYWKDVKEYRAKFRGGKCEKSGFRVVTRASLEKVSDERKIVLDTAVKPVMFKDDVLSGDCEESDGGFIVRYGDGNAVEDRGELVLNIEEDVEMMMKKGSVVTMIIRNLSFVPGNEEIMGSDVEFLAMCGEVLTRKEMSMEREDEEELENVMTTLSNIALHTDLSKQPSRIVWDIMTGLLYCIVSDQVTYTNIFPHPLTVQKIALEILCKLSFHQSNVSLLLATPRETLNKLCQILASNLIDQDWPVKELSISIIYYIVSSSSTWSTTIAKTTHTIPLLISFIEQADMKVRYQGLAASRANPSIMGTSLATLRRAATILSMLAQQDTNSNLFMVEEERLVSLAMSKSLDQEVAKSICEVMFLSSRVYESGRKGWVDI